MHTRAPGPRIGWRSYILRWDRAGDEPVYEHLDISGNIYRTRGPEAIVEWDKDTALLSWLVERIGLEVLLDEEAP